MRESFERISSCGPLVRRQTEAVGAARFSDAYIHGDDTAFSELELRLGGR